MLGHSFPSLFLVIGYVCLPSLSSQPKTQCLLSEVFHDFKMRLIPLYFSFKFNVVNEIKINQVCDFRLMVCLDNVNRKGKIHVCLMVVVTYLLAQFLWLRIGAQYVCSFIVVNKYLLFEELEI